MALTEENVLVFAWVFTAFDTAFVVIRFQNLRYWRLKPTSWKISEALIVAAWLMTLLFTAIVTDVQAIAIKYRATGMPAEVLLRYNKLTLVEEEIYVLVLWLVKWSFMFMYYGMLPHIKRWLQILWHAIFVWTIITFFIYFLQEYIWCRPASSIWTTDTPNQCSAWLDKSGLAVGAFVNSSADVLVILFAILILNSLTRRRSEVLGILFMCVIGAFVMAASFIRLGILLNAIKNPDAVVTALIQSEVWGGVEVYVALWVACLPRAKVFFVHVGEKIKTMSWPSSIRSFRSGSHASNDASLPGSSRLRSRSNKSVATGIQDEVELGLVEDMPDHKTKSEM